MPELLLELLSEEIPARMQAGAARDLAGLLSEALAPLVPQIETLFGPRRLAAIADVAAELAASSRIERGPRLTAPPAALAGFLRKHGARQDQAIEQGDYWMLSVDSPARPAAALIAQAVPALLRRFPWPKSMRWGGTSSVTWIRPLRRILCLLDGVVVPFDLRDGADDGHGLASAGLTEGHRFMAPGAVAVGSAAEWRATLATRRVMIDAAERRAAITAGIAALAAARNLEMVDDEVLLDEVAGLVEWPVPLLGRIDPAFMDLPPEVMQVSMRLNQRYFALREAGGRPAPWFAFVANIVTSDHGAAIIAGNERVLRARFADARHFWDLDRAIPLAVRVSALGAVTFHARLGSQADRTGRLQRLAAFLAPLVNADPALARRAAELAKADLTTGMVGEFPELQGIMGGYYALHDGEAPEVAAALRDQYRMVDVGDSGRLAPVSPAPVSLASVSLAPVCLAPVSLALALADRLDLLAGFFGIGEKPTGSGDPYALRRAGLSMLTIIQVHRLRLALRPLIAFAAQGHAAAADAEEVLAFLIDRLRIFMRGQGGRHDVLQAVFASGADDDVVRLIERTDAITRFLNTPSGSDLLALYRRAASILRIENAKDGPHDGPISPELLADPAECDLSAALARTDSELLRRIEHDEHESAMDLLARLRGPTDRFMTDVRVNDADPRVRANRLRVLSGLVARLNLVADFSKIEG